MSFYIYQGVGDGFEFMGPGLSGERPEANNFVASVVGNWRTLHLRQVHTEWDANDEARRVLVMLQAAFEAGKRVRSGEILTLLKSDVAEGMR